jgi:hypothetical protein
MLPVAPCLRNTAASVRTKARTKARKKARKKAWAWRIGGIMGWMAHGGEEMALGVLRESRGRERRDGGPDRRSSSLRSRKDEPRANRPGRSHPGPTRSSAGAGAA